MGLMKQISDKAARNMRGQKKRSAAGGMTATNFDADVAEMVQDLTGRQLQQATKRMSTILRAETVKLLKRGSSATLVGRSQYNKTTRGDWKSPRETKNGVPYLKGGWYGEVLKNRGANKPSMAYNGGDTKSGGGNRGIITRTQKRKGAGWMSVTGPRYGQDSHDNGKYGYNYAHMLEYGGRHKNWNKSTSHLQARPFLAPAAALAYSKQKTILKQMLTKWGKF